MNTQTLDVTYRDHTYPVVVNHTTQYGFMHVFKIHMGQTRYWIVYNGNTWKFYSDISPCMELKKVIINKLETVVQTSTAGIDTAGLVKLAES